VHAQPPEFEAWENSSMLCDSCNQQDNTSLSDKKVIWSNGITQLGQNAYRFRGVVLGAEQVVPGVFYLHINGMSSDNSH